MEKYELNWLGKEFAKKQIESPLTTELVEDKEFNKKPENINSENILIKGDNLEVLKHLKENYFEKIKMIYIDPPYNTKSRELFYNDNRKHSAEDIKELFNVSLEEAKQILKTMNAISLFHSAWMTFMYPRLCLAKQLLRDDGVIFVSIDNNEIAQLKLIMDEIYGEENFVEIFIRKTKLSSNNTKICLNSQHEYCVCYAKNKKKIKFIGFKKNYENFKNPDEDPKGEWVSYPPSVVYNGGNKKNDMPIINPYTGKVDLPPKGRQWIFTKQKFEQLVKEGRIVFKKEHKNNERGFIYKKYKNELKSEFNSLNSLLIDNDYLNQVATKENLLFFKIKIFNFPKPKAFIKKLISIFDEKELIILDFFAGSGTTGDAVMQINAEDGGNRKFILVQLDEPIDSKKNQEIYNFVKNELKAEPTIFEITKERLIRAAKKIETELNIKNGFKIFELQKKI